MDSCHFFQLPTIYLRSCLSDESSRKAEPTRHYKNWNARHYLSRNSLQVAMGLGSRTHQSEAPLWTVNPVLVMQRRGDSEALPRRRWWQDHIFKAEAVLRCPHPLPGAEVLPGQQERTASGRGRGALPRPRRGTTVGVGPCSCTSKPGSPILPATLQAAQCYFNQWG